MMMQEQELTRQLFLHGEINDDSALELIKQIKLINEYDDDYTDSIIGGAVELQKLGVIDIEYIHTPKRQPIILDINSGGGALNSGFALISAIENSSTPIIGYVTGFCMSMAVPVLASCHYRISTRYADFMLHEPSSGIMGNYTEMETYLEFVSESKVKYIDVIAEYTDLEVENLNEILNMKGDQYFNPEKAKEYGIIDSIDTEDITQEDILEVIYAEEDFEQEELEMTEENENVELDLPLKKEVKKETTTDENDIESIINENQKLKEEIFEMKAMLGATKSLLGAEEEKNHHLLKRDSK